METIEDILRDMRSGSWGCSKCGDACDCPNAEQIVNGFADRIEAAYNTKEEYALFSKPHKKSPWCFDGNTHSLEVARITAACRMEFGFYKIRIKKRNVTEWTLVEEVKK